jgi:thymidylate kinase
MDRNGLFVVFESAPKGGKTTLSAALDARLNQEAFATGRPVVLGRGALTNSEFAAAVKYRVITDIGYSTAFYWADLAFYTQDVIVPTLENNGIMIQDRYDLSIISYREVYGLYHDEILLEEYLKRGSLLNPDLTVFLEPSRDVMCERIQLDTESSPIDRAFLDAPPRLDALQDRTRHYLQRFNRRTLSLDTGPLSVEECIARVLEELQTIS